MTPFLAWLAGLVVGGVLGWLNGNQHGTLKTHLLYNRMLKNALKEDR